MRDAQLPAQGELPENLEPTQVPPSERTPRTEPATDSFFRSLLGGSALMSVLAVVLALLAGAVLIVLTDATVQTTAAYFFSRPTDLLGAVWTAVSGAYSSLFQGSVYDVTATDFGTGIRPLTETLTFATPLIVAGLGVALSFRVGLFNIGGQGQVLAGAACAGWVGFAFDLPFGIHLLVALIAGVVGAALLGGLVGFLKAQTGAHEVIVTIMLNYVVVNLLAFLLRTPGALQAPGSNNPQSPAEKSSAIYPHLFGPGYNLTVGFLVSILATVFLWYLFNRSSLGFRFRAVGESPTAARVSGINVKSVYFWAMALSGGLVGLAGVSQVLGSVTTGFSVDIDASIGFDAITVALLGRSRPWGVFFAGILFGALKAGGFTMQAAEGIPIDIVLVVQSLIVLFIAAPPLVRTVFRLPPPTSRARSSRSRIEGKKAVVAR